MKQQQHTINKIVVNANGININSVFGWRNRLSNYFTDDLPKRLQVLFDECCMQDELITIEKVNIIVNLQQVSNEQLLEKEILSAVEKELSKNKISTRETAFNLKRNKKSFFSSTIDSFIFYLEKGYYPWFAYPKFSDEEFTNAIKNERVYFFKVLSLALKNAKAEKRFTIGISNETFNAVLLNFISKENHEQLVSSIAEKTTQSLSDRSFILKRAFVNVLSKSKNISSTHIHEELNLLQRSVKINTSLIGATNSNKILQQIQNSTHKKSINDKDKEKEQIWTDNAGIILLYPFLQRLYQETTCINKHSEMINAAKALSLLHYMLYQDDLYSDGFMVLPKMLCGIEYDEPVFPVNLSEEEKGACNSLLLSVIEHWSALKKTSITGLRNTFLLRRGKLSFNINGVQLHVEQKTEDILIDRLPWGIGIIKLPWMNMMITTAWR